MKFLSTLKFLATLFSTCNFKNKSYCKDSIAGLLNNLNVTHLNNTNFLVSANLFGKPVSCSETFNCLQNGTIKFSNDKNDCLYQKIHNYDLNMELSYNNIDNKIDISTNFGNFELNPC